MHNQRLVLENDTHKLLWNVDIQTEHLISAKRTDLMIIKKKRKEKWTCKILDFAVPSDHRVRLTESEKTDKYREFTRE